MDHDPQTHRDSQSEPNQIAGGLVYGPNGFALGAAKAYGYGHERPEKQRTKKIANIRSPSGMVDPCVPGSAGLLMGSNSLILLFSPAGFAVVAASAAVAVPAAVEAFAVH
jgi:hypothetical protein